MDGSSTSLWIKLKQRWLLILFALPFAGVGVGMLVFGVLPSVVDAQRMQSWHSGEARLISAGLEENRGDDSTTYRAHATYTYEYRGRKYSGDRVAVSPSGDNIGGFQQQLGRHLEQAQARGQPVAVWINPDNPAEAVLNRELRWGKLGFFLVFVLVFGGVGVGLLLFCLFWPTDRVPGAQPGDTPWLTRREWLGPTIKSEGKAGMWGAWIFAAFWNAIAFPIVMPVLDEFRSGNTVAVVGLLFPVVGVGLLAWAITATLRWRRFGETPLTMDPYPGAIGGQVGGTVELRIPYDPTLKVKATLNCLYSYLRRSGKKHRRSERLIWQSEGFAQVRPGAAGTRLEVLFNVDARLPPSDFKDDRDYHLWRVHLEARLPGADLNRTFEIPVFATGEYAQHLQALCTEHEAAQTDRLEAIEAVLDVRQLPGGVELFYPPFKHPGAKLAGLLVSLVFLGMGIGVGRADGIGFLASLFGVVGAGGSLLSGYNLCLSTRVRFGRDRLEIAKWLMGLPVGNQSIQRVDIRALKLKRSYSSSSGRKQTVYYKIQAVTAEDKAVTVGYNLAGRNTAEHALESLSLLTGIPAIDAGAAATAG